MMTWQTVFRTGFAPQLSTPSLEALADALANDTGVILQGATVVPPPLQCLAGWPVEATCPVAYCGWLAGDGLKTVAEVEEFFARACYECDALLGEPAACREFLNVWDEGRRSEMFAGLLEVVRGVLADRRTAVQAG